MAISINHMSNNSDDTSSFRPDDKKLLSHPKGLDKIHKVWRSSVVDVDLYTFDMNMPPDIALTVATTNSRDPHAILAGLENTIKPNPETITVVFTQNEGAKRMPLTGWIIAHRMFHAFQSSKDGPMHHANRLGIDRICVALFDQMTIAFDALKDYSTDVKALACAIGTTKACRDGNLSQFRELVPECFAQYMLRGRVRLNRINDDRDAISAIEEFEAFLNTAFGNMIEKARGGVFAL